MLLTQIIALLAKNATRVHHLTTRLRHQLHPKINNSFSVKSKKVSVQAGQQTTTMRSAAAALMQMSYQITKTTKTKQGLMAAGL